MSFKEDINVSKCTSDLDSLNDKYEDLPEEKAKVITIPSIFNRTFDENFVSDYLAYILDPDRNGIGYEPLLKLLGFFRYNILDLRLIKNKVDIKREYVFRDNRRIDILIVINDVLVVGIEHKIFSGESINQTIDYQRNIDELFPDLDKILIFLTPHGTEAMNADFTKLSYVELRNILKEVILNEQIDTRNRVIYKDFILYIEEHFMGRKFDGISEKTKLYLDNIDVISDLYKSYKNDSETYYHLIQSQIKEVFSTSDYQYNFNGNKVYQQIIRNSWVDSKFKIHHEFHFSSENILSKRSLFYRLDIEGKENKQLISFILQNYGEELKEVKKEFNSISKSKDALYCKKFINPFFEDDNGLEMFCELLNKIKKSEKLIDMALNTYNR